MPRKHCTHVASFCLPILVLALAGCNSNTTVNKPAAPPTHPAQYTQIDYATAGTVSGTIQFTGKAPTPIAIDMLQDPACALATKTPNYTEQYVVQDGKMANVFIYVKDGLGNRIYMPTKTPVVLDQRGCRYEPHFIVVMVGQPRLPLAGVAREQHRRTVELVRYLDHDGSTAIASIEMSRPRGNRTLAGAERAGGGSGMCRA